MAAARPATVSPAENARAPRRSWTSPRVVDLPRLTELTLQTGSGIPCGGTPSGSTVCP